MPLDQNGSKTATSVPAHRMASAVAACKFNGTLYQRSVY